MVLTTLLVPEPPRFSPSSSCHPEALIKLSARGPDMAKSVHTDREGRKTPRFCEPGDNSRQIRSEKRRGLVFDRPLYFTSCTGKQEMDWKHLNELIFTFCNREKQQTMLMCRITTFSL